MEEEEIKSYASPGGEPHSPPSRITVTVATPAPPSTAITKYTSPVTLLHQSNLTLALPIQHTTRPIGSSGGGGGGREDCWSEDATSVLIDAWGERYMELSRGNLKQKHWKEVADIVSSREDYTKTPKTDIQCKNRIDTVKKKYKIEKAKVTSGCGPSRWPFFERLDCLLSPPSTAASTAKVASPATASVASVGINSHKMVPMGIPMGVRPLPLPGLPNYSPHHHFQIPPHFQPQLQPPPPPPPSLQLQQQFRQNNFPSLPPMFNKFNNSVNNPNSTSNNNKPQIKRGLPSPPSVDSESDQEGWSLDSADSLPPLERKRPRVELNSLGGKVNEGKGKEKAKKEKEREVWGNSVRELTRAILKFGEAYEAAESAKLQQIVEMEKQRMKFAKEMELQRMKFFMKTQLELSQLNDNGSNNSDARAGGSSGRAGGVGIGGGGGESNHHNHHDNHLSHAVSDASD